MMFYRSMLAFIVAVLVSTTALFGNTTAAPMDTTPAESSTIVATQPAEKSEKPEPAIQTVAPSPTPQPTQQVTARQAAIAGNSLTIAAIGFQAPLVEVGTTATNNIDVPAGLQVGRWTGSALPGRPGAVFLDGHVDGVFKNLHSVTVGQRVQVAYDDQTYRYQVVHTEVVPLAGIDMRRALNAMGASEGLNIMTCAGSYVPAMGTYDHRLVVYTVRVS